MALKIRLRQQGKKNRVFYRLVLTDVRSPRDGKYLETLGWYNPYGEEENHLSIHTDRVSHWLAQGAEISPKAEALVKQVAPKLIAQEHQKQVDNRAKKALKRKKEKSKAV